jgi:hypothetical protein
VEIAANAVTTASVERAIQRRRWEEVSVPVKSANVLLASADHTHERISRFILPLVSLLT